MPSSIDVQFAQAANQSNIAEITAGTLALQRAPDLAVNEFGRWMVTDHGFSNAQLSGIASAAGIALPTTPDAAHQAVANALAQITGPAFTQAYLANQVLAHEMDINLFTVEAQSGTDPALKSYASSMLPVLQQHLTQAVILQAFAGQGLIT